MQGLPKVKVDIIGGANNFLEKAIKYISPTWGLKRARNNFLLKSFDAASKGPRTINWLTNSRGPNDVYKTALVSLRDRSRDLRRNNPYAERAITSLANNLIGTGIRPQWNNERLQELWKEFAENNTCDVTGKMDFFGLQHLAGQTVVESGEALAIRVRDPKAPVVPFRIQILEPDFIDSSKNSDNPRIIQGVEVNAQDKPVALWLFPKHPQDSYRYSMESKRVSMDDIAHIFVVKRPGQLRGIPWVSPVTIRVRDFDDYEDAFLFRQKLANAHAGFLKTAFPSDEKQDPAIPEKIIPGALTELPPGMDISFNDPPNASGDTDFRSSNLRAQSVGWGVTYEMLSGDLSDVNFSSGRMGHLEFNRTMLSVNKNMTVPQFCEKVESWFLQGLALRGFPFASANAEWRLPKREMVSPKDEIPPIRDAIRSFLISPQQGIAMLGSDPDEVMKEWKQFKDRLDELGLVADIDPSQTKPGKRAEPSDE